MKIFGHHIHAQILLLWLIEYVLAASSFYLSTHLHVGPTDAVALRGPALLLHAATFAAFVSLSLAAMGLLSVQQRNRATSTVARVLAGLGLAATGLVVLDFLYPFLRSPSQLLVAMLIAVVLVSIGRLGMRNMLDDERFRRRVLVYGAGKRASSILALRRRSDQRGFRIVAFAPAPGDVALIEDERVLARSTASLFEIAKSRRASEIVVALDDRRREFPIAELLECKFSGIDVIDLLEFLERETGRIKVDLVNPAWLIFSDGFSRVSRLRAAARIFDLLLAALLLLPALPIMAIASVMIFLDSGAPVLFRQERIGLYGNRFTLYKFRSMRQDAEVGGQAVWAAPSDPRITRVGAVLRKLRFDELPQLFNVLGGTMSLVGPRPERPEFVAELAHKIPYYHERHYVKPGMTGWAQLCYPYGASDKDALAKLEYDIFYIKNKGLLLDLMILLQTAEVVLWQKGSR